jgi:hypothetical protein
VLSVAVSGSSTAMSTFCMMSPPSAAKSWRIVVSGGNR